MVLVATATLQSMCYKLNLSKVLRIDPTHPAKTLSISSPLTPSNKVIFSPASPCWPPLSPFKVQFF